MIGLTSYMEYATAQKKVLNVKEGIVIYSTDEQEVPMVVVFIPAVLKSKEDFSTFLKRAFSDPASSAYIVYFQAVRWILPDIADTIRSLKSNPLQYGVNKKEMKVSYGRLTFDKTYAHDPENVQDLSSGEVDIIYTGNRFTLTVSEWPDVNGTLKLFEKIDF